MVPPGYILGQVAAPRVEEPEEPLYVNAKQVSVCLVVSQSSQCIFLHIEKRCIICKEIHWMARKCP